MPGRNGTDRRGEPIDAAREPGSRRVDVAVVGAGAGGILTTFHLLRRRPQLRVAMIDTRPYDGGVAYGAAGPEHLLNVKAMQLSADPDDPSHFAEWAQQHDPSASESSYLPRRLFGAYLRSLLTDDITWDADRLQRVNAQVVSIERHDGTEILRLDDGTAIIADTAVLALGNPRPRPLADDDGRFFNTAIVQDPFEPGALARIEPHEHVVVVGSALSAVDVVVALERQGHTGTIELVSRHGELPKPHCACGCLPASNPRIDDAAARAAPPDELFGIVSLEMRRARDEGRCWQPVFDSLRDHTESLWARYGDDERKQFVTDYRHMFDQHRHRVAPSIAADMDDRVRSGRVRVTAGVVERITATRHGQLVRLQGGDCLGPVARVVNATGPDLRTPAYGPLADQLVTSKRARPGWGGSGLDVDEIGALRNAGGEASDTLFALGPVCRGSRWETTAIPEMRRQAATIAKAIVRSPVEPGTV